MKKIFLMILLLIFATVPLTVNAAVYQQGVVYVIYDATGENAPKNMTDANSNGVPDMVEDVATQVNAARELFNGEFNFPDPLKSSRFKNVTCIEVDILSKTNMKNRNGVAYGGARKAKHNPAERAIHIKIANTLNPHKNSTPAHEYFHLIQYGATYFRNKWFLEGMARWSQDAVQKTDKYPDGRNFPQTLNSSAAENKIFQGSYDTANSLWYPLAVNMNDKAKIPARLVNKYRYVDGSRVFHDDVFYGPNVMRETLNVMKSKEEFAANSEQYANVGEWRKKGQRDQRNNKIIMDCVKEVYGSNK